MEYAASARVDRLRDLKLERLAVPRVVDPEPEHPGNRLGSEPRLRAETGVERREHGLHRRWAKPDERDEPGIELAHGDGAIGVGDRDRDAETGEHDRELGLGQWILRPETLRPRAP